MLIAITPYKILTQLDIEHYKSILEYYDCLIIRTPMTTSQLIDWITTAIEHGISKDKLTVHSNVDVFIACAMTSIHFSEYHSALKKFKTQHPQAVVSMSTHSEESVIYAEQQRCDYVLFGHVFPTPSKPHQAPRSQREMTQVLNKAIKVIALGGVNVRTLPHLPRGFAGIAGISLFYNSNSQTLRKVIEEWSNYV
ncbi:thiamine phosphate synthase [Staphylococcus kloosii]|uniref:thiamine phosphate synthase n=1 Tax=Staphylococcus kloosii TaxID=29384 RepID=UPI0028A522B2|nr:thiamine phosphate synthase [Staphylococcus kloosii]MDT3960357.1 thiamine phosphate synthase [Staphylococcus kloosii]